MRDERPAAYRGERVPTNSEPDNFPPPYASDRAAARSYVRRKAAERLQRARAEARVRALTER